MKFLWWEAKLLLSWLLDHVVGIRPERIVFVTKADAPIAGNLRILLDAVVDEGKREVGVFKEGPIAPSTVSWLQRRGVRVMRKYSIANLAFILSSATVVLSHSGRDAYLTRRKKGRRVVNVWHGVALKKMEAVMPRRGSSLAHAYRQRFIRRNSRLYDAVIASGEWDRRNNAAAFAVAIDKVHATGYPRIAYLSGDRPWPHDLAEQAEQLTRTLHGRKLVLYAPTFREQGLQLTDLLNPQSLRLLSSFCEANNLLLGIRPHAGRLKQSFQVGELPGLAELGAEEFPEPAVLLSAASMLITDYSGIWIDYLVTDRPIIGYVPDWAEYQSTDRGFVCRLESIFPGPLLATWGEVVQETESLLPSLSGTSYSGLRQQARQLICQQKKNSYDCIHQSLALLG